MRMRPIRSTIRGGPYWRASARISEPPPRSLGPVARPAPFLSFDEDKPMRLTLAAFLLPLAACVATPAWAASCPGHWTAAWASAQLAPTGDNALAPGMLAASSLRQIVRPSVAGDRLRVPLSNLAAPAPPPSRAAHLSRTPD